jgi:PhoP regulatory network protein YrbL
MSEESSEAVSLRSLSPFASGTFRDVFIHPADNSKCIKIDHRRYLSKFRTPLDFWEKELGGNAREASEYYRLISSNVPYEQYFPRFYGTIKTDLGPGLCVELLKGTDGKLPVNLYRCFQTDLFSDLEFCRFIRNEYQKFWNFCERHLILSASVGFENVGIIQIDGTPKLVSFDIKQVATKKFISWVDWSTVLKKKKIGRRFARHLKILDNRLSA